MPEPGQLRDGLLVQVPQEVFVGLAGVAQTLVEGLALDHKNSSSLFGRLLGSAVDLPAQAYKEVKFRDNTSNVSETTQQLVRIYQHPLHE